jgi:hypothetical protein
MCSITDNLNTSLSSLVSHFTSFLKNRDLQSLLLEKTVIYVALAVMQKVF